MARCNLKDDREGKFHISWYEGKSKKWHPKTCTTISEALRVKADKEWFVQNQNRPGVQDPILPDARIPISVAINGYIDALMGAKARHRRQRLRFLGITIVRWTEKLPTERER
jgi:hypothetical protein